MRGTASARPVDTCHVQINVVGNGDFRVGALDVVFGPVVAAALAPFLARPEAENHRAATGEVAHCFSDVQHHTCAGSVVVSADASSVAATASDVWI